jgi:hypothetical protein
MYLEISTPFRDFVLKFHRLFSPQQPTSTGTYDVALKDRSAGDKPNNTPKRGIQTFADG